MSNVARAAGDDRRRLVADIETTSFYNWLRQPQIAAVCVTSTEEWLSQTDVSQTCCRQYAELLIIKAETLLLSKKVMCCVFVTDCAKNDININFNLFFLYV